MGAWRGAGCLCPDGTGLAAPGPHAADHGRCGCSCSRPPSRPPGPLVKGHPRSAPYRRLFASSICTDRWREDRCGERRRPRRHRGIRARPRERRSI